MTKSSLTTLLVLFGLGSAACSSDTTATKTGDGGGGANAGGGGSSSGGKGGGSAGTAGSAGKAGSAGTAGTAGKGGNGGGGGSDASTGDGAAPYVKGCEFPDASSYDPTITPADFSTTVDNKFFPLVPGTTFQYRDADGNGNDFEVTTQTKVIQGVTVVVVHDVGKSSAGDITEDTFDWFAQKSDGSVWYFGEDTKTLQNGQVTGTTGSWEAGKDCAKAGTIMEAAPAVNDSYREEYYAGEAEDEAKVVSVTQTVEIPYNTNDAATGTYSNCLRTDNTTRLEPGKVENKWYCEGIGEVRSLDVVTVGTGKAEELIAITHK